jgi:hypothetical protein
VIKRALSLTITVAGMASAVVVCVIAAAFAIYSFSRPWIGEAYASGLVAVLFALVALALAFGDALARACAKPWRPEPAPEPPNLTERLIEMARGRPIAATGIAIAAAAVMAIRNPAVIGVIARAFLDGQNSSRPPRR